jgi:hypothetical protein
MSIGLEHYLILAGLLFSIGLYGALTKRRHHYPGVHRINAQRREISVIAFSFYYATGFNSAYLPFYHGRSCC